MKNILCDCTYKGKHPPYIKLAVQIPHHCRPVTNNNNNYLEIKLLLKCVSLCEIYFNGQTAQWQQHFKYPCQNDDEWDRNVCLSHKIIVMVWLNTECRMKWPHELSKGHNEVRQRDVKITEAQTLLTTLRSIVCFIFEMQCYRLLLPKQNK